jgi:hypothetical protein
MGTNEGDAPQGLCTSDEATARLQEGNARFADLRRGPEDRHSVGLAPNAASATLASWLPASSANNAPLPRLTSWATATRRVESGRPDAASRCP